MSKVRVLLADDHGIVRKGLRFVLEREGNVEVVGEAADGREAVKLAGTVLASGRRYGHRHAQSQRHRSHCPDCKKNSKIGVIMLSMYSDEAYLVRALSAGAKGYLLKDSAEEDLVRAVQSVAQEKPSFSPAIARTLLEDHMRRLQQENRQDSYELLTDREKEILQLLAEGKSNKEVATLLSL